jgi:uncharacterized membrane protein
VEKPSSLAIHSLALFGIFLSGCNFYHEKHPKPALDLSQTNLSYATVNSEIFSPQCISCHNSASAKGGVVLESYETVKANLDQIYGSAVINQTMPRTRPLAPEDRALLSAWILAGAPREGTSPNPPPTPLEPTYTSIRKLVFEAKCVSCHTAGESAAKVPLSDYNLLMNSPRDLVLPGNADESGLIIALERTDDHQMPPPDSGLGRISSSAIATIREWILNGAKND